MIGSEATDAAGILPFMDDVDDLDAFYLSTADGAEVPRFLDWAVDPIDAGYATLPPVGVSPVPPFDPTRPAAIEAVSDGETTLRLLRHPSGLRAGRFAPHLLAGSDGGWSVVDGA